MYYPSTQEQRNRINKQSAAWYANTGQREKRLTRRKEKKQQQVQEEERRLAKEERAAKKREYNRAWKAASRQKKKETKTLVSVSEHLTEIKLLVCQHG